MQLSKWHITEMTNIHLQEMKNLTKYYANGWLGILFLVITLYMVPESVSSQTT